MNVTMQEGELRTELTSEHAQVPGKNVYPNTGAPKAPLESGL